MRARAKILGSHTCCGILMLMRPKTARTGPLGCPAEDGWFDEVALVQVLRRMTGQISSHCSCLIPTHEPDHE